MTITDKNLVVERIRDDGINGVQRIYGFKNNTGLSLVNGSMLHSYKFAWEAAVINDVNEAGGFTNINYDTPLTNDIVVFETDDETNEFIQKAEEYFESLPDPDTIEADQGQFGVGA